jgi:TetR/AcrR family transcriptional regulator
MDTKAKIIAAAIEVFAEKGKHGARMEEIAARASVNKAMLYYFYTTRENLYIEVLAFIFREISKNIGDNIRRLMPKATAYDDKIKMIVKSHFDAYSFNLNYTKLILEAMAIAQDDLKKAVELSKNLDSSEKEQVITPEKFHEFIKEGVAKGIFRKVDSAQLLISIVGMNLIYFLSQPIARVFAECGIVDESKFLKTRQESVTDILLNGLMAKRSI